jgi:integrase
LGRRSGWKTHPAASTRPPAGLHVVQQLRYHADAYGGFYVAPPKAGSAGDVDLDDHVAEVVAQHVRDYPPVVVTLPDITGGTPDPGKRPRTRKLPLLFTDELGRPISSQEWSRTWNWWRRAAKWPQEGTYHSLRHYFATALIAAGHDPTDVQRALRHAMLRITLETYVHWSPKKGRRRNVVSNAIRQAEAAAESGLVVDLS